MGILDDAIREHLELKRQHGAEGEDLERLENEAFGPATRPGDPDFAEPSTGTGEGAVVEPPSGEQAAGETGEQPSAEQPGAAGTPAAEPPSGELVAEPAEPATGEPPGGGFGIFDADAEFGEEAKEIPADVTPAERARAEHAHLDDTVDHPAPVQLGPEDEAEPDPGAADEPVEPQAAAADATEAAEPKAEDGAADETEPAEPEAEAGPAVTEAPEKDIFAGEDFGLEEIDLSIEDEPESGEQRVANKEEEDDGEDLLEETPDFLQETEGEDLWFEQGPPRDFDFDDD